MIRLVRPLAIVLFWVPIAVAAGVLAAAGLPFLSGDRSFTVMSGSMEPAIHTGDVVVDTKIRPQDARVGDVVTFADPVTPGRLVTHRLRSVHYREGRAEMITKGDANNSVERWSLPLSGTIGRVAYRLPRLGYALAFTRGPISHVVLIVIPVVILGVAELYRIWRPRRREPVAEAVVASE